MEFADGKLEIQYRGIFKILVENLLFLPKYREYLLLYGRYGEISKQSKHSLQIAVLFLN